MNRMNDGQRTGLVQILSSNQLDCEPLTESLSLLAKLCEAKDAVLYLIGDQILMPIASYGSYGCFRDTPFSGPIPSNLRDTAVVGDCHRHLLIPGPEGLGCVAKPIHTSSNSFYAMLSLYGHSVFQLNDEQVGLVDLVGSYANQFMEAFIHRELTGIDSSSIWDEQERHEARNLLNIISNYGELLSERFADLPPDASKDIQQLVCASRNLACIVD